MSRHHNEWTDRFTEYLAGDLDEATQCAVEDHVAMCGACRHVLEEIRDLVARAAELDELTPARDLWPGIAAAIDGPLHAPVALGAQVIELPTARGARRTLAPQRVSFTVPQLAAASIVLVAASALATWWAGPGVGTRSTMAARPDAGAQVVMAAQLPEPPSSMAEELADLEDVISAARSTLDPNTVRVLERNLAVIERAIADSRVALSMEPGNEYLSEHLQRVYERKLTYLRDAARVIDWSG